MSFRARLFLALALAGVVPLGLLAVGIRREVDRRLTGEYRARVDGAVRNVRADLARESAAIQGRLGAFAAQLASDNRFRASVVDNDPAARSWTLDWGRYAIRQAGLAVLQLQDSSGRILSSGHFRQEYDQVRPDLPGFLSRTGGWPALAEVRTPEGPLLALVRSDSFTVAGRRFTLVGGVAAEDRFLGPLPGDSGFALRLVRGDSTPTTAPSTVAADLPIPFLPLAPPSPVQARLMVSQPAGTLTELRRSLDRWFIGLLLATALAAVAAAAWLAARISRPLTRLAEQTAAIDLDRLDHDFATDRADEIGALSRLLGAMTARLRSGAARLREAERRVAMGDLARQVNHDIKNGLVPIRNVLRHLDEVAGEQPQALAELYRERRGTLESSVAYLDTLARNYARISPSPSREPCDLNALVQELVRGNDGGGRLHAMLADTIPPVPADRLMLRRVLENLIGNALESLDGRTGTVTIATEAVAGPAVRITVADSGRGMSRAELDRAFDDFFTTKPGGTGLGLSIARRLVLDLGGSLRIETEPGSGTRAIVELPA
jgi:two-component system, NtrC family, nitrogen regulation sensor histidine kinase NtrY